MSRSSIRAVATLKAKAAHILEERKRERREGNYAWQHGIRVVTVFLNGDPKIDEPLHLAERRAYERFGLLFYKPVPAEFFYERIVKDLPGATPEEKLAGAIERVPDWLSLF